MPNRRTVLTLLAAAAATACAAPPAFGHGALVDLQVVDRGRGETLAPYRFRGASWVVGRPGDRYAVRLTNRSAGRVLVVLSVDGVNAVSGETAGVGQTGYVLAPWQSTEITGWRKNWSEAAAFYFTALADSYAARTDRPDNVGVIGAAIFRERVAEYSRHGVEPAPPLASEGAARGRVEAERRAGNESAPARDERPAAAAAPSSTARDDRASAKADAAAPAPSQTPRESFAAQAEKKLGTGHGEREYAPTTRTAFERATATPAEIVQVRYDSYANLVAAGVIARQKPWPRQPDAFPSFVPDPG